MEKELKKLVLRELAKDLLRPRIKITFNDLDLKDALVYKEKITDLLKKDLKKEEFHIESYWEL